MLLFPLVLLPPPYMHRDGYTAFLASGSSSLFASSEFVWKVEPGKIGWDRPNKKTSGEVNQRSQHRWMGVASFKPNKLMKPPADYGQESENTVFDLFVIHIYEPSVLPLFNSVLPWSQSSKSQHFLSILSNQNTLEGLTCHSVLNTQTGTTVLQPHKPRKLRQQDLCCVASKIFRP